MRTLESLSEPARRALFYSRKLAQARGQSAISVADVAAATLIQPSLRLEDFLAQLGTESKFLRGHLQFDPAVAKRPSVPDELPLDREASTAIKEALRLASQEPDTGDSHLLAAALLADHPTTTSLRVTLSVTRDAILAALAKQP